MHNRLQENLQKYTCKTKERLYEISKSLKNGDCIKLKNQRTKTIKKWGKFKERTSQDFTLFFIKGN